MNDTEIKVPIGTGTIEITSDVDTLNKALAKHGLHIAPLPAPAPPPQTEAERLVEIAKGLPDEVWKGCGWEDPQDTPEHDIRMFTNPGWHFFTDAQFPVILLGVMAAYVGTAPNAQVCRHRSGWPQWSCNIDDRWHDSPDLLTAYADCCKAIAERRKGGK